MPAFRRLIRAASAAALALALAAPATMANTTVEFERIREVHFDFVASAPTAACGFPIELHTSGPQSLTSRYDDGRLVQQHFRWVLSGYFLNPANGKTVTSKVAGPERIEYGEDGSIIDVLAGATVRTVPGAGLVSGFIGLSYVELVPTGEVDEEGFPIFDVVDERSAGQVIWYEPMCQYLA
jgi:hypothetical protein